MVIHTEHTTKSGKWINAFIWILGLGMAAFFGVSILRNTSVAQNTKNASGAIAQGNSLPTNTADMTVSGMVLGQSDIALPGALKSENYMLGQVVVGGDATLASADSQELGPLEISAVRGEAFMSKDKKDVNVLITWKTTKFTMGVVSYGKNGSNASKTLAEDGYGRNHSIILSGLEQSSAYVYTIAAKDRSGNEVATDSYAVYTGAKSTSLFDLISNAVSDTFGWAIKK